MAEKKSNKKLNIILLSVLGVLIVAIIIVVVALNNTNKKNRKAFNEEMSEFCKEYNLTISEDGMEYTIKMTASYWDSMSIASRQTACDVIAAQIATCGWEHHIFEEPWLPIVYFYVGDNIVAAGSAGNITLK